MGKNLEAIAGSPIRNFGGGELDYLQARNLGYKPEELDSITTDISGPRKKELQAEIDRIFVQYMQSLRNNPHAKRAVSLDQAYNLTPDEEELDGKDAKEILRQRLYSNPGRQYQYVHGIVGNKKKSKDIKYELGKAAQYTIKEGWPGIGAGAGWYWANNHLGAGALAAAKGAMDHSLWQYITNPTLLGVDTAQATGMGIAAEVWGAVSTPLLYGIGAYAAYKTLGYFLKRRREKKLENAEIENMEKMQNNFRLQQQMFQPRVNQMRKAA